MRKILILIILIWNYQNIYPQSIDLKIPFTTSKGSIFLQLKDKSGESLNILFDSGSNEFILSKHVLDRLNVKAEENGVSTMPGGNVHVSKFGKIDIFDIDILNEWYTSGSGADFDWYSEVKGIRIDGLIGIKTFMKLCFEINFQKKTLIISNTPVEEKKFRRFEKLDMIYSDDGFQTRYSNMLRVLPAAKTKILINESDSIEANMLFDSGSNKPFALLTNQNIDSLLKTWDIPFRHDGKKRINLVDKTKDIYTATFRNIIIDNKITIPGPKITINEEADFIMKGPFGSSKYYILCGFEFMKNYKQIHLDYIQKKVYLVR